MPYELLWRLNDHLFSQLDGVEAVHELHIWQLAGNRIVASAHVWCANYQAYKRVANQIKNFFHDEGIHSTTIQPEFDDVRNVFDWAQGNLCKVKRAYKPAKFLPCF